MRNFSDIKRAAVIAGALLLLGAGCGTAKQVAPDGGVFKSGDGGETWRQINAVPTAAGVRSFSTANVLSLVADPTHTGTLYAGTATDGLFVSYTGGADWRRLGDAASVRTLVVDPTAPCTLYASVGNRVMKSIDCGRTWSPGFDVAKPTQEVRALALAPDNPRRLYIGLSDGVFLVSNDAGESGAVVYRFNALIRKIVPDAKNPARMYVVTEGKGLWRSNDAGNTWSDLREPLRTFAGTQTGWDLATDPTQNQRMIYASPYGLLRSDNSGDSWTSIPLITAPGEARIYAVAINPQSPSELYYSAVVGGKSLLYKTVDWGGSWRTKKLPTTRIPTSIHIRPDQPQEVFIGTYLQQK
ncbi:MAG: hypothetical protein HY437_02445 [Candidatus Magasanikbacteria bacterium]|nr:hypothetical protein [Candidatus Magasanikbacteria bacterium]